MMRLSDRKDIPQIISLWNEAFGDTEEEIRFFLDSCYVDTNTLVYETDGEIASVLFLIEGDMCIEEKTYPSYYLYAASTLKKYRGRGLMGELLSFAKQIANERKKNFICLKPGEKTLFDFYEKNGYKTVFKIKKISYDVKDFPNSATCDTDDLYISKDVLRNDAFSGYNFFKWDKQAIDFAFRHTLYFGGKAFMNCEGFSLYTRFAREIIVKETTFTDCSTIIKSIDKDDLSEIKSVTVHYPPWIESEGEIIDYAMITAVNDSARNMLKNINNAYLGLTLD